MSNIELKYYSNDRPISSLELDFIKFDLPSDFRVVYRKVQYRGENKVYIVKVDYINKKIIVEFKE